MQGASDPTPAVNAPPPLDVAAVYASWPQEVREALLSLRRLVLETADELDGVGAIEETLRWGQPAYLTSETGSGTTIRLAPTRGDSSHDYAMFFICHTHLVTEFERRFGELLDYDGDRALLFRLDEHPPAAELRACITMALTYHASKA